MHIECVSSVCCACSENACARSVSVSIDACLIIVAGVIAPALPITLQEYRGFTLSDYTFRVRRGYVKGDCVCWW